MPNPTISRAFVILISATTVHKYSAHKRDTQPECVFINFLTASGVVFFVECFKCFESFKIFFGQNESKVPPFTSDFFAGFVRFVGRSLLTKCLTVVEFVE